MIELYIEDKKVDLTSNIDISLVLQTIDPDNLASIKNSFSKTIDIKGTPNNNTLFNNLYRNDNVILDIFDLKTGIGYDPHKKVNFTLLDNGALIYRGYCVLNNIIVKNLFDITYKVTLYGGIGEFFYALSYNEDGTQKTLADLFWNWIPLHKDGYDNQPYDKDQESTNELYNASLYNVTNAYHKLDTNEQNTNDPTYIDKDIVFVPCYTGLYEDFDSEHMLVCTSNWDGTVTTPENFLSNYNLGLLQSSFPSSRTVTEDDTTKTYTVMGKTMTSQDDLKFGLATFSREVDPYEAADLRINELPLAIRLSKLLNRISDPVNNNGYNVIWDQEILDSYYWKYSWVLLDKIKSDAQQPEYSTVTVSDPITVDTLTTNMSTYSSSLTRSGHTTFNVTDWTRNDIDMQMQISLKFELAQETAANINNNAPFSGQFKVVYRENPELGYLTSISDIYANYICYVSTIYDANSIVGRQLDVFYFYNKEQFASIPQNQNIIFNVGQTYADCQQLIDAVNNITNLNLTKQDVVVHLCSDLKRNVISSGGILSFYSIKDNIILPIRSNNNDLSVTVDTLYMFVNVQQEMTPTGPNTPPSILTNVYAGNMDVDTMRPSYQGWFTCYTNNYIESRWPTTNPLTVQFKTTTEGARIAANVTYGYAPLSLTKDLMFKSTNTPMKYLTDFAKILNLSFECDHISKTVRIMTKKNYYNQGDIDITDNIDNSRNIEVKHILSQVKSYQFGLENNDAYPIYLYNKKHKHEYDTTLYNTNIEYNINTDNILKNIIYKNAAEWQQSSIFYNNIPQIPKPYNNLTISWSLWTNNNDEYESKEFITNGISPTDWRSLPKYDAMPKIALFDKNNQSVDANPSFIFLNGFVKNYDYIHIAGTGTAKRYMICPRLMFSKDSDTQYILNGQRCYIYGLVYSSQTTFDQYNYYQAYDYAASSWYLPFFTRDLYNIYDEVNDVWQYAGNVVASWSLTDTSIDDFYRLTNDTIFVKNQNDPLPQQVINSDVDTSNEYTISSKPIVINGSIYSRCWLPWLTEIYGRNSKEMTIYVKLPHMYNINTLLRKFYTINGVRWTIVKIDGYKLSNTLDQDQFAKVTLKRVVSIDNYSMTM